MLVYLQYNYDYHNFTNVQFVKLKEDNFVFLLIKKYLKYQTIICYSFQGTDNFIAYFCNLKINM